MKRLSIVIKFSLLIVMTLAFGIVSDVHAATWATPGNSSTWNTAGNWSPAVVPQDVDVTIDGETGSDSTVSLDVDVTNHNLTVSSGDMLTVNVSPYVITIDGRDAPVVVNNEGTVQLDGNVSGGKGLTIEGDVTWTNNGLSVVGNQNQTQFRIQSGAALTVSPGTSFDFRNQTFCSGTVTNYGTFKIGGLFYGVSGKQVNSGVMEFRDRMAINLVNYIGSTQGELTLHDVNQEQTCSVEGGLTKFVNGNYNMHRGGMGNAFSFVGNSVVTQELTRTISMIRRSTFNLDAGGTYTFDGPITMDTQYASTHNNAISSDCKIVAKNGQVDMVGDGSLTMTAGILTHSTAGDMLRHSILTGVTNTDALINNLAGGISGAGKIGDDTSSFVNNSLIDATDATYTIDFDPADTGSISNLAAGTIRATGAAGLLFQDGTFVNEGTLDILPDSQAVFTNGLVLNNDNGTLAFTLGASTTQTPVIKVYGDVTLSGTLSVDVLPSYDGTDSDRYDVITCTGGTITDNGLTLVSLDDHIKFSIIDNGTADGTVTIGHTPPAGTVVSIK